MALFAAGRDEGLNRKMTNLKSSCDVARHARCGHGDQIQSASKLVFPAQNSPQRPNYGGDRQIRLRSEL